MEDVYYNYIYLDPRKKGHYCYEGLNFSLLYEPFYVGKGKNKRYKRHIYEASMERYDKNKNNRRNLHKIRKIQQIEEQNLKPFILIINNNSTQEEAYFYESNVIDIIGRRDIKTGPLTNLSNGGEGQSGFKHSENSKNKISSSLKQGIKEGRIRTQTEKKLKASVLNFQKYSKSLIGKNYYEIHGDKAEGIIEKFKGENNHFFGKRHSEETKRIISEKAKKRDNTRYQGENNPMSKSIIISINGKEMKFNTIKSCKEYLLSLYNVTLYLFNILRKNKSLILNDNTLTIV